MLYKFLNNLDLIGSICLKLLIVYFAFVFFHGFFTGIFEGLNSIH